MLLNLTVQPTEISAYWVAIYTIYLLSFRNKRGADKSLARSTSGFHRTESIVSLEKGSDHVPYCKSFLVTEFERNKSGEARIFNNIET